MGNQKGIAIMNIIVDKLKERMNKNSIFTKEDYQHELREITQELVMAGLANSGLFSDASFHGGTALRLFYNIKRYSEDLDFTLDKYNNNFKWEPYLNNVKYFVGEYGCLLETKDVSKNESVVKKAFIKDSSIEKMMNLSWRTRSSTPQKINIKLEMDTNPPLYSECELKNYDYPCNFNVKTQKLSSLFSGKCHALLCREYEKGRDWFDFEWFVKKGVVPNYDYLSSMLKQQGPWKNKDININKVWLCNELENKNRVLNYDNINKDIKRFTFKDVSKIYDYNMINMLINQMRSEGYGSNVKGRGY